MRHTLSNLTAPVQGTLEAVGVCLKVHHGLVDAFLGRLDERPVLDNILVEGLAGNQHEAGVFGAAFFDGRGDGVAGLFKDDVVVGCHCLGGFGGPVADVDEPRQRVRERVPAVR